MSCDPQTLISGAACIECQIPTGMQLPVLIYLLCQIQSGGVTGGNKQVFTEFKDSVTIGGTLPRVLFSDVIPGGTITTDGQRVVGAYMATSSYGGSIYNASCTITLNGSNIFSQTLNASNPATWYFQFCITQNNTTNARCYVVLSRDYASGGPSQIVNITNTELAGVNFTQPITLQFIGQSNDAAQTVTAKQAYGVVYQ